MRTDALVSMLIKQYPALSRAFCLQIINEIQNALLCNKPLDILLVNNQNGCYRISLQDNIKEYEISVQKGFQHDIWYIANVLNYNQDDYNVIQGGGDRCAKLIFKNNPTCLYADLIAYRRPTQILTETIQLEVPSQYHFSHVYIGAKALIEMQMYGHSEEFIFFIEKKIPDFVYKMTNYFNIKSNNDNREFWSFNKNFGSGVDGYYR